MLEVHPCHRLGPVIQPLAQRLLEIDLVEVQGCSLRDDWTAYYQFVQCDLHWRS